MMSRIPPMTQAATMVTAKDKYIALEARVLLISAQTVGIDH